MLATDDSPNLPLPSHFQFPFHATFSPGKSAQFLSLSGHKSRRKRCNIAFSLLKFGRKKKVQHSHRRGFTVDSRNSFSKRSMMNGALMASASPCQFHGARIGEPAGRVGLSSGVRLGQLKPLKKVRRVQVQAAVDIDGKPVTNGPLRGSKEPPKATLMVDPLEAKRLAAEEWRLLQERAAFQKKKRIEAINGGWAVLGLTIGIIVEGYTGKGILSQVAGYIDSLAGFVATMSPPTLPTFPTIGF